MTIKIFKHLDGQGGLNVLEGVVIDKNLGVSINLLMVEASSLCC